jgi:type IV pilus assembly protein PilV
VLVSARRCSGARGRAAQSGALLIEVLIAVLICAFGLLGFAGMQARAVSTDFETLQRSEALVLLEDMVSRINANRAHAGDYVSAGLLGAGAVVDCTGLTGAALDLCEWSNLIRGNAEQRAGTAIGSMISARGCITRPATSSDRYVVSIAWQGIVQTAAPASPCGQGDAAFPDETLRRTASATVCVALLRDAASAPVLSRC